MPSLSICTRLTLVLESSRLKVMPPSRLPFACPLCTQVEITTFSLIVFSQHTYTHKTLSQVQEVRDITRIERIGKFCLSICALVEGNVSHYYVAVVVNVCMH